MYSFISHDDSRARPPWYVRLQHFERRLHVLYDADDRVAPVHVVFRLGQPDRRLDPAPLQAVGAVAAEVAQLGGRLVVLNSAD